MAAVGLQVNPSNPDILGAEWASAWSQFKCGFQSFEMLCQHPVAGSSKGSGPQLALSRRIAPMQFTNESDAFYRHPKPYALAQHSHMWLAVDEASSLLCPHHLFVWLLGRCCNQKLVGWDSREERKAQWVKEGSSAAGRAGTRPAAALYGILGREEGSPTWREGSLLPCPPQPERLPHPAANNSVSAQQQ